MNRTRTLAKAPGTRFHLKIFIQAMDETTSKPPSCCHHLLTNRPLNSVQLEREGQKAHDQPGCIHANMDMFKWALRLWPLLPSEQLVDALELAVDCRMLVSPKTAVMCQQCCSVVLQHHTKSWRQRKVF